MMSNTKSDSGSLRFKLDHFYHQIKDQLIKYQHPISGLFKLDPDDEQNDVSHVRDSLYCAHALFAMYQCYKKIDDTQGRTFELGQRAIKCVRAILEAWMTQSNKLESFKHVQSPENSLHTILSLSEGCPMEGMRYQHLQMDCIALFILLLVQMIHTGLEVIFTKEEVVFVQNLVFYIERAYRIPDFGMWERGTKQNNGTVELCASSIGMAKAALEASVGFNLFGQHGDYSTVLFVDIDAHCRNRIILSNLLPRQSASRGQDVALIPTLSWPAFASHRADVRARVFSKMQDRFEGEYGYRRFTRDGYKCMCEDPNRQHYRLGELKIFENVESEWPMIFAYLLIDKFMSGHGYDDTSEIERLNSKLRELLRTVPGEKYKWLPKYYAVPHQLLDLEREKIHTQKRIPATDLGDTRFLWGQAVYIISQLLYTGVLSPPDLDPIGRRLPASERWTQRNSRYSTIVNKPIDLMVQVVLISESVRLQQMLSTYGIQSETPRQVEPILIWPPENLVTLGEQMGNSETLGLVGRPKRPYGQLGTSKFYRIAGHTVICYPLIFESQDFYLPYDMNSVIDEVKTDLKFLSTWWRMRGRPTFLIYLREDMIRGPWVSDLIKFLTSLKTGNVAGVRVLLGRAQNFVVSGCVEHLDYLHGKTEYLEACTRMQELDVDKSFQVFLNEPGTGGGAGQPRRKLSIMCQGSTASGFADCVASCDDEHAFDATDTDELISGLTSCEAVRNTRDAKLLTNHGYKLFTLVNRLGMGCVLRRGEADSSLPNQLSVLGARAGVLQLWSVARFCAAVLRKAPNSLAPSLSTILVSGKQMTIGVPGHEEYLVDKPISPKDICQLVFDYVYPRNVRLSVLQMELILHISNLLVEEKALFDGIYRIRIGWLCEAMKFELRYTKRDERMLYWLSPTEIKRLLRQTLMGNEHRSPLWTRQVCGCLNRVPLDFYPRMYRLLERAPGIRLWDGVIERSILSDITRHDINFVFVFESVLQKVGDPAHRQLIVETLMVVSVIVERNPEVEVLDTIDICQIVDSAWEDFQRDTRRSDRFFEKSNDMTPFFSCPTYSREGTSSFLTRSVINTLLKGHFSFSRQDSCAMQ